jgi:site-specific recombinase XerD
LALLTPDQRKKLSDKGLIEPDEPKKAEVEISLSQYLKEYLASRQTDVKASTQTFYRHTWKRLEEYFPGRTMKSITASDAKQFRLWLQDSNKRDKPEEGESVKPLAINTIKRRTGLCRQIFKQAIEDGLISQIPS